MSTTGKIGNSRVFRFFSTIRTLCAAWLLHMYDIQQMIMRMFGCRSRPRVKSYSTPYAAISVCWRKIISLSRFVTPQMSRSVTFVRTTVELLTPSTPAVPNCCCSKGPAPYWSNPPFFTARAYARAVLGVVILSVRLSVCPSVRLSVCHTRGLWQN